MLNTIMTPTTNNIQRIDTLCDIIENHLVYALEKKKRSKDQKISKDTLKEKKMLLCGNR